MFEDYSERLFAHYVAGRWRAPFVSAAIPVRLADGHVPGQIIPAGPRDVARAAAARRGAEPAAIEHLARRVEAAQSELSQAIAAQTGHQPDPEQILAMAAAMRKASATDHGVILSAEHTGLEQIGKALGAGLSKGVIWCPHPTQALLATTFATVVHEAELPAGAFALLHARVDTTEAALRASVLPIHLI